MSLGKFLLPKELPKEYIDALFSAYKWGYSDKEKDLPLLSYDEVKFQLNRGFKLGMKKRGFH